MGRFKKLVKKVEQLVEEKNTTVTQVEKPNEIKIAIISDGKTEVVKGIGDTLVLLITHAKRQGVNLLDCLEDACTAIPKQRKRMIDGITFNNTPFCIFKDNHHVIIKEDGDFLRTVNGQIIIFKSWLDAARELKYGEVSKSTSILSETQKEILKENFRIFNNN